MTPEQEFQELQERRQLLFNLEASNDPAARQQAEGLRQLYHDRQMAGLADDVYDAAKHQGQPPAGWMRLTEHPELMRDYASRLGRTEVQLLDLLQPEKSGFRAEIYLPDPEVLGPGYKPVLSMKGSSGKVATANGLRDTATEDFLANNFPQSIGQRTDYYDRAMSLALRLQASGLDFEMAGHSLAGGMVSAASIVTGMQATTYNPAGVHTSTTQRFASELGLRVGDPNQLISVYLTKGEVLNDGLQINVDRMDRLERTHLASVLKSTSDMLQTLPEGEHLLKESLDKAFPPGSADYAKQAVHGFVAELAHGDTNRLLDQLPLAVGQVHPMLGSMGRDAQGRLVERPQIMSLQELTGHAAPLLGVLAAAGPGMRVGRYAGEQIRDAGALAAGVQGLAGDASRVGLAQVGGTAYQTTTVAGLASRTAVEQSGYAAASVRQSVGALEAGIDHLQGQVEQGAASWGAAALRGLAGHVPDRMGRAIEQQADTLERAGERANGHNQQEAAQARASASRDAAGLEHTAHQAGRGVQDAVNTVGGYGAAAVASVGLLTERNLDTSAGLTRNISGKGPLVGAGTGGIVGMQVGEALQSPTLLGKAVDVMQTSKTFGHASEASGEAVERHLMTETVIPSMDHRIEVVEQEARARLQQVSPTHVQPTAKPAAPAAGPSKVETPSGPNDPEHPQHAMLEQIRNGVRRLDEQAGKPWDQASEQLSHGLLAVCRNNCSPEQRAQGASLSGNALSQVDHVLLGVDGRNVFAVEGALGDPAHKRAHVDVQQAIATPVEHSDRQLAMANQAITLEQSQLAQQQIQRQGMESPAGPRMV